MKTKKPQTKKKHAFMWIILSVAVLLAGGFGIYTQMILSRPAAVTLPALVRIKIPTAPASSTKISTERPAIHPQPGQEDAVAVAAANNMVNVPSSLPDNAVTGNPQQITGRDEPENDTPPTAGAGPTGAGKKALVKPEPSGSADNQSPGSGPYNSMPMAGTAAADESQSIASHASAGPRAVHPVASQPTPVQQMESGPAQPVLPKDTKPLLDPEQSAPFTIQVGAYLTKSYADQSVSQLMEKGYDAYIFQRTDKKQRAWYLVRFGHFQDRAEAVRVLTVFKDQERMEAGIALSNSK